MNGVGGWGAPAGSGPALAGAIPSSAVHATMAIRLAGAGAPARIPQGRSERGDTTTPRRPDEAETSERVRAHAALLEEALERPGIPELMRVYGAWRTADRGLDPYRAATRALSRTTTTDHANLGQDPW